MMHENVIFFSYRRADSAPYALALKLELESRLRAAQVFVDTHHIQGADRWANEIDVALRAAKVIIPVMGRDWVGTVSGGGRRIDDPEDWVRKEISVALKEKITSVLPLLVDYAKPLKVEDLPNDIQDLAAIQAIHIDANAWKESVRTLVDRMSRTFGFERKNEDWHYPKPDPLVSRTIPVPWEILDQQVRDHLRNWSVEFSEHEEDLHRKRIELTRTFSFKNFKGAINFMNVVAKHADTVNHHPRWENVWNKVKISLSTWDAGHRVTALDIEFACYLDRLYRRFAS